MEHVYVLILAGGNGERLWPLSTKQRPKQVIPVLHNKSLLELTIERVQSLAIDKDHLLIITSAQHEQVVSNLVSHGDATVLVEPVGRNTAPAILRVCLELYAQDPDACIVVVPSDHFVPQYELFCRVVTRALEYVVQYNVLGLLGIKPTFPATGYGYIQTGIKETGDAWPCFQVQKFHEKPSLPHAQQYLMQHDMLWNIGMFVGKVKTFLEEFTLYEPAMVNALQAWLRDEYNYENLQSISLDYAVLEKSNRVVVFLADFEWHDVGNLQTLLDLKARYAPHDLTEIVSIGGSNNRASTKKKVVACIGVSDVCIVETDDVIVVARRNDVEQVKQLLKLVKERNLEHVA